MSTSNSYRTISLVTYRRETWSMAKDDRLVLNVQENKMLREMYGAVTEKGLCRIGSNKKLRELYKTPVLRADIEQKILLYLGHENTSRMDQMMTKNIFKNKPEGRRITRRSDRDFWKMYRMIYGS
jgi:hypothetical protein